MSALFKIQLSQDYFFTDDLSDGLWECFQRGGIYNVLYDIGHEQIGEHGDSLQITINDVDILEPDISYSCWNYLQQLNNTFYLLVLGKDTKTKCSLDHFPYPSGEYLEIERKDDKVRFIPNEHFPSFSGDYIDFSIVVEEVIRAVNEYKDIFWKIFEKDYPEYASYLMLTLFSKEERYTSKFYEDSDFDWEGFYRLHYLSHFQNIDEKRQFKIVRAKSFKELKQLSREAKIDKDHIYGIIRDYYDLDDSCFMPLETEWRKSQN